MAKQDSALEYLHNLKEGRIRPRSQQRCCCPDESTRLDESVDSDSSEDESYQSEFTSANLDAGYLKPKSRRLSEKPKLEAQVQQQQPQPTSWYHTQSQQRLHLVDLPPRPARSPSPPAHRRSIQPSRVQPPQILVATPVGPCRQQPPMAHVSPVFWQHPARAHVAVRQPSQASPAAVVGQKPAMTPRNVMPNLGKSMHMKWPPQLDNSSDPLSRSVQSMSTYAGSGSSNTSQLESFVPSMISSTQQGLPWSLPATPLSMARTLGSSSSTPASIARTVPRSPEQGHVGARSTARTDSYCPPVRPAAMQGSAKASYDSYTPPLVRPASSDQERPALSRNSSYSDICASVPTPRSQARSIPSSLAPNSYTPPLIPRSQSYSGESPRTGALSPAPPTPRGTPCFGGVLQATPVNCTGDASIARSLPLAHVVAKVGSAPNLLLKGNTSPAHHPRATF